MILVNAFSSKPGTNLRGLIHNLAKNLLILVIVSFFFAPLYAQNLEAEDYLVSGAFSSAGRILLESDQWQMTAEFGGWASSSPHSLYGESWVLTGGFLSISLSERGQFIFLDSFSYVPDESKSMRSVGDIFAKASSVPLKNDS